MFRIGDYVRVHTGWETHLRDRDYVSRVEHTGRVEKLLVDDCGATPQHPGLIVGNDIGLVWEEEVELVHGPVVPRMDLASCDLGEHRG